ncbi:hypothetical protein DFH09DRAFT_1371169 [Mycena vulgaris]|nr:hypothetical protein DFH09DRAFT_1371169 [Mycena vulgaris]
MLALLTLFFVFAKTVLGGSPPQLRGLAPHTRIMPRSSCYTTNSACTAFEEADSAESSLCATQMVGDVATCYGCLVASGTFTQADAQSKIDAYVSDCNASGFDVDGVTISSSGEISAGSDGNTGDDTDSGSSDSGTDSSDGGTGTSGGDTGSSSSDTGPSSDGTGSSGSTNSSSSSSDSPSSNGGSSSSGSTSKTGGGIRWRPSPVLAVAPMAVALFLLSLY